jgi:hypothetical protein
VYESFNAAKAVTVEPKGHYQNRFGSFFHKVRSWSTCAPPGGGGSSDGSKTHPASSQRLLAGDNHSTYTPT